MDTNENTAAPAAEATEAPAAEATAAPGGFDLSNAPVKEVTSKSEGAWMHLRHPSLGHELYVGEGVDDQGRRGTSENAKPVRVKILYAKNRDVIERRRRLARAATMNATSKSASVDQEEEIGLTVLRQTIVEFDNLYHKGRLLDAKDDGDKTLFFNMADEYVEQVSIFTLELGNFFDSGSKG